MERFFIRDCYDNIVGNPQGYATFKGASRQANSPRLPAGRAIWENFNRKSDEDAAKGVPAGGRMIFSIYPEKSEK